MIVSHVALARCQRASGAAAAADLIAKFIGSPDSTSDHDQTPDGVTKGSRVVLDVISAVSVAEERRHTMGEY